MESLEGKTIDYYTVQLWKLEEFNQAYNAGINVHNIFKGHIAESLPMKPEEIGRVREEAFRLAYETLDARIQCMYSATNNLPQP